MSRRVFISYRFENADAAHNVKTFFQPQGGTCQGVPVYVDNNVTAGGSAAIDEEIRRVMSTCEIVLFVVGDNTHNSRWVNREAEIARSRRMGMVAVQAPDTNGNIPNEITENNVPFVEWGDDTLCKALNAATVRPRTT